MKNKMKLWRKEAFARNAEASESRNEKTTHQGRKFKGEGVNHMKGATYPLLQALFNRIGLFNRNEAQV